MPPLRAIKWNKFARQVARQVDRERQSIPEAAHFSKTTFLSKFITHRKQGIFELNFFNILHKTLKSKHPRAIRGG